MERKRWIASGRPLCHDEVLSVSTAAPRHQSSWQGTINRTGATIKFRQALWIGIWHIINVNIPPWTRRTVYRSRFMHHPSKGARRAVTAGSLTVAEEQGCGRGTSWQALTRSDLATEDGSARLLRPEQPQRLTIKARLIISRQQQRVRRCRSLR
jgi:hypothetical protein